MRATIALQTWTQVREAMRSKHLRQAGYDEGEVITAGTLLHLHGDEHRARRRIENRLFRREVFSYWEHQVLGATVSATLDPFVAAGHGDLAQIGYRAALSLTATIAGIDHDPSDIEATENLYNIVKKFSEGATIMHSTRDKDELRAEVRAAMAQFELETFAPSLARRTQLIEQVRDGECDDSVLPEDVLTTLLAHEDVLSLPADVLLREICLYLRLSGRRRPPGSGQSAGARSHIDPQALQLLPRHLREDLASVHGRDPDHDLRRRPRVLPQQALAPGAL